MNSCSTTLKFAVVVSLVTSGILCSCSTPETQKPITIEERLEKDTRVGSRVLSDLESQMKLVRDPKLSQFLQNLGNRVIAGSAELQRHPVHVLLFRETSLSWHSYSLPGHYVYLPFDQSKSFEFENIWASAIALELAHVYHRHFLDNVDSRPGVGFFGPNGWFSFTTEQQAQATSTAVDILYRAGFDVRGVIFFWQNVKVEVSNELRSKLIEVARERSTHYPPLRNPIVRTNDFVRFQKRLQEIK